MCRERIDLGEDRRGSSSPTGRLRPWRRPSPFGQYGQRVAHHCLESRYTHVGA